MRGLDRVSVLLLGGLFVLLAFVGCGLWYNAAHNLDRCSDPAHYVYAADGFTVCPRESPPSPAVS
jgi:hypothetical protein